MSSVFVPDLTHTFDTAECTVALSQGYVDIPRVTWEPNQWSLVVFSIARADAGAGVELMGRRTLQTFAVSRR